MEKEKIMLETFHNIQDTYGYIPEAEIDKMAKKFDRPRAELYGIIKFYSMLYTEPTGKYIIRICKSLSCCLASAEEILESVSEYLGLEDGQTSKDKLYTLEVVECLGHCGEGPVMMVNEDIYTNLTARQAVNILEKCY